MSDETREPQTFEDLWLMRETSKEWFDGLQLRMPVRALPYCEVRAYQTVPV